MLLGIALAGCQSNVSNSGTEAASDKGPVQASPESGIEAKVASMLGQLSPEDRKLAESQKFCAVMTHERLGGMGVPLKLDVNGQTVFVCCKGCRGKAQKNPEQTLAKVAELKTQNAVSHP
jgi:hypothetical protein